MDKRQFSDDEKNPYDRYGAIHDDAIAIKNIRIVWLGSISHLLAIGWGKPLYGRMGVIKNEMVISLVRKFNFIILLLLTTATFQANAKDNIEDKAPFKDCPTCPKMIPIPAQVGTFFMGYDKGKKTERPRHETAITAPFALAETEITFEQYKACVDDGGCLELPWDRDWGMGQRPVIYVNFQDALDYAKWLSKVTRKNYRLPTESEWEFAAWGGDQTTARPTGKGVANCHNCIENWAHQSFPVAQYAPNGYGLYDMLGNVMEWTSSCWKPDYNPETPETCDKRVRRGGSWYFNEWVSTPTYRYGGRMIQKNYDIGFRVALTLDE